jgi:arabinogalactan endo-1,4-beta-galactosidase
VEASLDSLLQAAGIDTLRLSFFTDRSEVAPIARSLELAQSLGAEGRSLYLCMHCSDAWADPSHQQVPEEWDYSGKKALGRVFLTHLESIFQQVKDTGTTVRFIQVGNEISNGMLWPYYAEPYDYVGLVKAAHSLCRHYFPGALIVLHTDLGYSPEKARQWYAFMLKRKVDFDLVGLSYYPVWHGPLDKFSETLQGVAGLTGRKVLLAEVGYMNTQEKTSAWFGDWQCDDIPYSPQGQREYLGEFRRFCTAHAEFLHPEMFWWGMFSPFDPVHHPIALFGRDGHALPAFYSLNR